MLDNTLQLLFPLSPGDGGVMKSIIHKGDGYSTPTEGAVVEGKES